MTTPASPAASGRYEREHVKAVPELVQRKYDDGMAAAFCQSMRALKNEPTPALLRHLAVTEDALTLWALHLLLDGREVPPCLRWPRRDDTPQLAYITWLADVLWFAKRHPGHVPLYSRWRGLFRHAPASDEWHRAAAWIYGHGHNVGYYHAKGLDLTDAHKGPLMTMVSNRMRANRDVLHRLPELRDRIVAHAMRYPDRSGRRGATTVADRRIELLRLFLLAGRNRTLAADYHRRLSDEQLSRQALTRQMEAIEAATGMRLLSSRS